MEAADNRIVVHHVGGYGDFGPSEQLNALKDVHWVIYDIRESAIKESKDLPVSHEFVQGCIGAKHAKGEFNVTEQESASSLLPTSSRAATYTAVTDRGMIEWGKHTRVKAEFEVDVVPLDELVQTKHLAPPDFVSIDAQGAELSILQGASRALDENVLGIVLETEFSELYEGQGLFADISQFLRGKGFRFCDLYSATRFNVYPFAPELMGKGFLTFGESLFLRERDVIRAPSQRVKLAAIALAFDQLDYAMQVYSDQLSSASQSPPAASYGRVLADVHKVFSEENSRAPASRAWQDGAEVPRANGAVVAWAFAGLMAHSIAKKLFNRYSSRVAAVLNSSGLRAVANSQEARDFKQRCKRRGVYSPWLDSAAEFGLRML